MAETLFIFKWGKKKNEYKFVSKQSDKWQSEHGSSLVIIIKCFNFTGTICRFLEQQENSSRKGLETIVLVFDSCDSEIYEVLVPLYFPRSVGEEQIALLQLPSFGVGGPDGEHLFPDRQDRFE